MDTRITELCTPIVFASNKLINFYKKTILDCNLNYQSVKEWEKINPKMVNVFQCWDEEIDIAPGQLNDIGGKYGIISLNAATQALKEQKIQGLVTAPIHKKNVQSESFPYTGHTPYLQNFFQVQDVLMFMVSENMRVGLLTEHIPVSQISTHLNKERILRKLKLMHQSLVKDFGIDKPRMAMLGVNPHAGDEGLIGKEENEIISPALKEARQQNMMVFGPYSSDAFFARGQYEKFDGVLAIYHDQGLIPFKSLSIGEGVNYTAGLPAVRTSPDHGTAFDIAGKDKADESSLRAALFTAIDIFNQREGYADARKNPIRKMSKSLLARAVDEKLSEE